MNRKSGKKLFRASAWLLPLTALASCSACRVRRFADTARRIA